MVFDFINRKMLNVRLLSIGVEGGYSFEIGGREYLHERVGIGVNAVVQKMIKFSVCMRGER